MKALQRTLSILAALFLMVQTARHAYVMWLEPRASILDKFDQPLKDEIGAAVSVEELLRRYEPVRQEVDRIRAERRAADPKAHFEDEADSEPFKPEKALRSAITSWEGRTREVHALRFYWLIGFLLAVTGIAFYFRANQWIGLTFLIVGFSEMVYWTCPTFLGLDVQEVDRLLGHKLFLSVTSLVLLGITTRLLGVFREVVSLPD